MQTNTPRALLIAAALLTLPAISHANIASTTDQARAQFAGQRAAAAVGNSTATPDARSPTEKAADLIAGRASLRGTSAPGTDTATGGDTATERARALLAGRKVERDDVTRSAGSTADSASRRCETNNRGWCGVIGL